MLKPGDLVCFDPEYGDDQKHERYALVVEVVEKPNSSYYVCKIVVGTQIISVPFYWLDPAT